MYRVSRLRVQLTPMVWFVVLTLITVGLALGLPPDPHALHQLHTTSIDYRLAVAALLIPYVVIWYFGFYAFAKLLEYARTLKGSKDGDAFRIISYGMGALAFTLVIPTAISLVLDNVATHHSAFHPAAIIIGNYLNLFPSLLAFLLFFNGARMLVRTTQGLQSIDIRLHAPWFLLLAIVFSYLTIGNQYRSDAYHLPVWLLIATYIVPYAYSWMVGLLSAYDLRVYAKNIPGLLYQKGIAQFAGGIAVALIGSIAIQFIDITVAQRLSKSISSLLLADYLLLIIIAVGFILMALGTQKLKKIEEV